MSTKPKITGFNKAMMIVVAACFDFLEFILGLLAIGVIVNSILTVVKYCIFWFWFFIQGVNFAGSTEKITAMGGSFTLEMIPIVNTLPMFTAGVVRVIQVTNKDAEAKEIDIKKQNPNVIREKTGPQE